MSSLKNLIKSSLSYDVAKKIVELVLSGARESHLAPVAVAVLDSGGNLVAFAREDGCSLYREAIARSKAYGSLGMGVPTRSMCENSHTRPMFWNSIFSTSGGIVMSPGGVLIVGQGEGDETSIIIGAVGVR